MEIKIKWMIRKHMTNENTYRHDILIMLCQFTIQILLIGFHLYTINELEIKETTKTTFYASFYDIYLKFDNNDDLPTRPYDKRTTSILPL